MKRSKQKIKEPDTTIVIKKRKSRKNTVCGAIITKEGEVLAEVSLPTHTHVTRKLRETGLIPTDLCIGKTTTHFKRIIKKG